MKAKINKEGYKYTGLMTVIIFVLTLSLIIEIIYLAVKLGGSDRYYTAEPGSMVNGMSHGDFDYLVTDYYNNIYNGATEEKNKDYAIPYAVARYIEAGIGYRLHGNTPEGDTYLESMQRDREIMGEFSYLADNIDRSLSLE